VGGSLFAHYMGTITPDTFGIFASIDFVIMVVIGGLGSLWGSIAGAAFVTILPHVLGPLEDYKEILHGLVVVVVLLILPRGLVAGLADLARAQMARRGSITEPRSVSG
jgi:branched-chain amino acid transport system permease protein